MTDTSFSLLANLSKVETADAARSDGKVSFVDAMQQMAISSVFDIIRRSKPAFVRELMALSDANGELAYENARCYRGLAAGESLKLNLLRMDAAYLTRNERRLEIVKTISLKQLPTNEETLNKGWDVVVARLAEEGVAEFEITKTMLDADYPGHYLRRIKRISVSLPVTVGPYQDVRATLTQSYNAVQMSAQADAPLKENMRASQQIAVSSGMDDDGLFAFNFDDERYLPFEGTGAISRWTLTFSNPESQRDLIDSITDIVVHMRYTAKSGGMR